VVLEVSQSAARWRQSPMALDERVMLGSQCSR
jgi:hypothetical protein